mgnify:FL=1
MKKTFNNKKYIDLQTKKLMESINPRFDHVYLEIGGKFFDDQHASRVLSGFNPSVKYEIINQLNIEKEFIICISTKSIKKSKKRRDSKKLYTYECFEIAKKLKNDGYKVSICITGYHSCAKANSFITKMNSEGFNIYKLYEMSDYPYNQEKILSKEGLAQNDYIPVEKKLICIIAPGPDSGKFAAAISQIYHENILQRKISTYRKFETFLIPELSINNPINLASSIAMCDVSGNDTIDKRYFRKTGKICCLDERDNASFELLYKIIPDEDKDEISSFSETIINCILDCIFDLESAENHAIKEIIRRYKEAKKMYDSGKLSQIEYNEALRIYNLINSKIGMSENEINFFLKEAIDFWGYDCQSNVCLEELGELIQAICKYKREEYEKAPQKIKDNLLEEIADVHNMINQLEMYFGYEEIKKIRIKKIFRTRELLRQEMLEESLKVEN